MVKDMYIRTFAAISFSVVITGTLFLSTTQKAYAETVTIYSQLDNSGEMLSQQATFQNAWIASASLGNLVLGKESLSITFTLKDPNANIIYNQPVGVALGTCANCQNLQKYYFTDADRTLLSDGAFHTFVVQTGTTTLGVADGDTPIYITFFGLSQYHLGTHVKSNAAGTIPYLIIEGAPVPPPVIPQAPEGVTTIYTQEDKTGIMTNLQATYQTASINSASLGNVHLGQGKLYITFTMKDPNANNISRQPGSVALGTCSSCGNLQIYFFSDADRTLLSDGAFHTFLVETGTTTNTYADGTRPVFIRFSNLSQYQYGTKIKSNADRTIPFLIIQRAPPPNPCVSTHCVSSVFFLPGIEASRLYARNPDGSEKAFWEPHGDSDVTALAMSEDGTTMRNDIYTRDVIDSAYVPLKGNVYKSFIEQLHAMKNTDHTIADYAVIPYDWRLSLDEILTTGAKMPDGRLYYAGPLGATTTPYIIQELRRLSKNSKTGKVTIVAHSNGGLLAKALTDKLGVEASNLIDKIIFIAVPQAGTPQAVGAILHGFEQALPIKPLSALGMTETAARELARNMPSVYNLLPSANYFTYTDDPVITMSDDPLLAPWRVAYGETIHSGERLRSFLTDQSRVALPAADPLVSPIVANGALLQKSETVHGTLDSWTPPAGVALYEVAGWGEETLSSIHYYQGLKSVCTTRKADSTCAAMVTTPVLQYSPKMVLDGDGTVVASSALWTHSSAGAQKYWVNLKDYGASGVLGSTIDREHADILEVPSLRAFIQNVIIGTSITPLPQFISTSVPPNDEPEKQLHFTLHSPLSFDLYDGQGNHTGMSTTTNSLEENIPNSRYLTFGEVQYISVPNSSNVHLIMNGKAEGSFTLDLAEVEGNTVLATTTFAAVPSSVGTVATMNVPAGTVIADAPPLMVDENGDGTTDFSLASKPGEIVIPDITPPQTTASTMGTLGTNDWYRSGVSVTLVATDDNSGVKGTFYSLNNGASWDLYNSPIVFNEGVATIQYYSTDIAGNVEEIQSLTIKIDMTAPEAILAFSPTTRDIALTGKDNLSPVTITAPFTLTDEAGNTTTLTVKKSREGKHEASVALSKISYSTLTVTDTVSFPENSLKYEWAMDKKGTISELEQKIEIHKETSIKAKYEAKKNTTKIYVKEKGQDEKLKEKKSGLMLLQMVTNEGKLNIEY